MRQLKIGRPPSGERQCERAAEGRTIAQPALVLAEAGDANQAGHFGFARLGGGNQSEGNQEQKPQEQGVNATGAWAA